MALYYTLSVVYRKNCVEKIEKRHQKTNPLCVHYKCLLRLSEFKKTKKRQKLLAHFSDKEYAVVNDACKRNMRYATLSGQKVTRIYDFRHSHVSILANEGINIQEIAPRRLGHSKIGETWNTYAHLYPREEEKVVDILNKLS